MKESPFPCRDFDPQYTAFFNNCRFVFSEIVDVRSIQYGRHTSSIPSVNVRGKQAEGKVRPEEQTLERRQTSPCFLKRNGTGYVAPDRRSHDIVHNVKLREPLLFLVVEKCHRIPRGEFCFGKFCKAPRCEFIVSIQSCRVDRVEIYGWVGFADTLPRFRSA